MLTVRRALTARLLSFPITSVATFLTAGLVIQYSGAQTYGQVMLIASVFALIPMADLGTGSAIINSFADPKQGTPQRMQVLKTVILWLIASGTFLMLIALGGMTIWSWSEILGIEGDAFLVDGITAGSIALFAISIPFSVGQRMLIGLNRNEVVQWISATTSVVALLATVVVWTFELPGLMMALALPCGILFSQILAMFVGFRSFKSKLTSIFSTSASRSREVFASALPMLCLLIAMPIALQGHRFIVAHRLTPLSLSEYTMAMQLYSPLWSFLAAAAMALWPLFSAQRHLKDLQRKTVIRASYFFATAGFAAGIGVAFGGDFVANIISDGEIRLDNSLTFAVGMMIFLQSIQQVPGMFFTSSKGLLFQSVCVVLMTITAISLSLVLTPKLGPESPFICISICVLIFQIIPGFVLLKKNLKLGISTVVDVSV